MFYGGVGLSPHNVNNLTSASTSLQKHYVFPKAISATDYGAKALSTSGLSNCSTGAALITFDVIPHIFDVFPFDVFPHSTFFTQSNDSYGYWAKR